MPAAPASAPSLLARSARSRRRRFTNGLAATLVTSCFAIAVVPLAWLLYTVTARGGRSLFRGGWFTSDLGSRTFSDPGGGAYAAIVGTVEEVALCAAIAVPVALLVAIYLVEYGGGWAARTTTFAVDILTGIPSIVAALFVYTVFLIHLGGGFAGVYASIALVLLMIPVVVRTSEQMLRLVPNEFREAAYALGLPKWRTLLKVVLPTARSGIVTGVVLGIARVAGETAPLLVLVKYSQQTNYDLLHGFQGSLPLMIKDQVNNLGAGTVSFSGQAQVNLAPDRMWGAALTLIGIVMTLNLAARLIGRRSTITS